MEVIQNPIIDIYDRLTKAVEPICGENTSMSVTEQVSTFPFYFVKLLGNPTLRTDLEGNETYSSPSVQCESFANGIGALNKAFSIDALSHREMINMGFRRTYGPVEEENSQRSIKRVISRYERLLGNEQTF